MDEAHLIDYYHNHAAIVTREQDDHDQHLHLQHRQQQGDDDQDDQQQEGEQSDLRDIMDQIFKDIEKKKTLGDEDLLKLHFMFGRDLEAALPIVDEKRVHFLVAQPSGRSFFKVQGREEHPYICFHHFCSCKGFLHKAILKNKALCCKHQIAARIALGTGVATVLDITDVEYIEEVCK